jgi:hypothetical protein
LRSGCSSFGWIPKIAKSYGSSIFSFLSNFHVIYIMAMPFRICTNREQVFQFLHILTSFFWDGDNKCLNRCEVMSHCSFDLPFPDD